MCKIGKVVLINDKNLPRHCWKLGIVETLLKSFDEAERTAMVRVSNERKLKIAINYYIF